MNTTSVKMGMRRSFPECKKTWGSTGGCLDKAVRGRAEVESSLRFGTGNTDV